MKRVLGLLFLHAVFATAGLCLFIALFRTPLASAQTVFFYRGCELIAWTGLFHGAVALGLWRVWRRIGGDLRDVLASVAITACVNLVFFTHMPASADRSVTVFLLGYLGEAKGREVSRAELEAAFVAQYVKADDAIGRRLKEQSEAGTLVVTDSGIALTPKGANVVAQFERMTRLFNLNPRLVHPSMLQVGKESMLQPDAPRPPERE